VKLLGVCNGSGIDGPVHDAATERWRGTSKPRDQAAALRVRSRGKGWGEMKKLRSSGVERELGFAHREAV
jgi:hypothetical protein